MKAVLCLNWKYDRFFFLKLEFVKCPYINKCFNLWVFYVLSRFSLIKL